MLSIKTQKRTLAALKRQERHDTPQYVEEHGGRFVTCTSCGKMWSVHFDGAGHALFEEIARGDDTCQRR